MKKIKLIYILIAFAAAVIFTGCGTVEIVAGIDDEYTASLAMSLSVPTEGYSENEIADLDEALAAISEHLQAQGYEVGENITDDGVYELTLLKEEKAYSLEDAVTKLLTIMGDEASPFSHVEGGYAESYLNEAYSIQAEVDLSGIVDYEYIDSLPDDYQDRIGEMLEGFSGTVTFVLPGTVIGYEGEVTDNTTSVALDLYGTSTIYSLMQVPIEDNQEEYTELVEEVSELIKAHNQYVMLLIVCAAILFVIAVLMVVFTILRKKKAKKLALKEEAAAEIETNGADDAVATAENDEDISESPEEKDK